MGVPGVARKGVKGVFGFGERAQKALRVPSKASSRICPCGALLPISKNFPSLENSSFVHVGVCGEACSRSLWSKVAKGGLSKFLRS